MIFRRVGCDHREQRRVDAIRARGQDAQLTAFFAAVEQELPGVLEIVAIDNFSKDALGGYRCAIGREHQGNFALRHHGDGHFDDPILPAPKTEMQSRRKRLGLIPRFIVQSDQATRFQTASAEPLHDDPDLPFRDQHSAPDQQWLRRAHNPRTTSTNTASTTEMSKNMNIVVIIINILRCGCAIAVAAPSSGIALFNSSSDGQMPALRTQRVLIGEIAGARTRGSCVGSPFQMPTRLADGLGPESDLGDGSPPPFAPPRIAPGLGPPR